MSKHKFKIGDRVIAKGVREIPDGATGTVIEYSYRPFVAWDQAHKCTFKKRGHPNANVYAVPEDKIELIIKTMDTVEKNGKTYKATEREDGSILLEPICCSTAKYGDVHIRNGCEIVICAGCEKSVVISRLGVGKIATSACNYAPIQPILNIFDFAEGEYVKKQDVIDALSHKDEDGDTVVDLLEGSGEQYGCNHSLRALRELGIIED